ncbi:GPI-anchored surface protein, putative, partial [Bodo saltans]
MLAVVGHLPTSSTSSTSTEDETTELQTASPPVVPPHDTSAMMFLMQCDAIVTSIQDEVLIRSACSVASAAAAAELAAATARSSSSSARRSNQGTPPPSHLTTLGDEAPPPLGSPAAINKNAAHEPSIILTRFAAHEPPLTFHPKTFVAQRGVEYRISPHEGVVQLGALLGNQQKNNRASKKSLSLASHVLSSSSPLGAKLVEEDLQDSDADEHDNLRGPNHHAGGGGGSQNVEGRDEYRLTGVDAHAIGALRQEQQRKRATTQAAAATSHHLSSELENHNNASGSPPATNAFAMSLRAEHYDAEMSQLAEMRRQLGVPYVADSAVPVNWGSMGGAAQPHNNHRGIGRHTAARSTARGQHDNAAGHIMVQSSSSPHNSRTVGVGSHNSPPSSSSLRHPIVGTGGGGAGPGGLVKPPPASRHYRCTFLHDVHSLSFQHHHSHHSRSGGTLYEYNLLHPGDPLQCAPLNMDTACQGRTAVLQQYIQSSSVQTTTHAPAHRQLQLFCLQVLRAIQFSV